MSLRANGHNRGEKLRNATYIFDVAHLQHMQRSRRWCIFAPHATLRTLNITLLKNFLAYDKPRFFVTQELLRTSLSCLRPSSMSSSAVILHWVSFRTFCVGDLISCIHPSQIGFAGHCLRLDYGQLNRQFLVYRHWCRFFFVASVMRMLGRALKNCSQFSSTNSLLVICAHIVRIQSICSWQVDILLASAAKLLRTTLLIFLLCQLSTDTGTRHFVILACTAKMRWPCCDAPPSRLHHEHP